MGNLTHKVSKHTDINDKEIIDKIVDYVNNKYKKNKPSHIILSIEQYEQLSKHLGLPDISQLQKIDIKDLWYGKFDKKGFKKEKNKFWIGS